MEMNFILSKYNDDDVLKEISSFCKNRCEFDDFFDFFLFDGVVKLIIHERRKGNKAKEYVPAYFFHIYVEDVKVGHLDIRIGYNENLYYGGHIGYTVDEIYRGKGYAGKACRLAFEVASKHKMKCLSISNEYNNEKSIRVCQKIGAKYIRTVTLPPDNNMRLTDGDEAKNIWFVDLA